MMSGCWWLSSGSTGGEHIAADRWLVPTEAKLRAWFDLPETIAALANLDADADDGMVLQAIEKRLQVPAGTLTTVSLTANERAIDRTWIGSAGLPVRWTVVASIARYLSHELRRKPIPQLAAVRSLDAVHAIRKPVKPQFGPLLANGKVLALTRYDVEADRGSPAADRSLPEPGLIRLKLLQEWTAIAPDRWSVEVPAKATGVLLSGCVLVDRDTSARVEVVALCASPHTSKLDDPERKRTGHERLEGVWPKILADPSGSRTANSRELFGFDVAPDGQVTLPRTEVTLLQIDGVRNGRRHRNSPASSNST